MSKISRAEINISCGSLKKTNGKLCSEANSYVSKRCSLPTLLQETIKRKSLSIVTWIYDHCKSNL